MRNQRLFGVVIAVLLGTSLLHQSPSAPHAVQSARHSNEHQLVVAPHPGGTGIELASAALPADATSTPLALGEVSPIGLLRPVRAQTLGPIQLASATVPVSEPASLAQVDDHHIGLLRPAGTRFVKLVYAWMSYQAAHPPPPPPPPPPAPKPVVVVAKPVAVVHHTPVVTPAAPAVAPATAAAGGSAGGVWAELRQCESGGKYAEDTGNGYYGAYQFSPGTWHGLGYPGLPSDASPAVQDQAAQKLQARSGWGQWPGCSRKLGLL
jgi:Transglycosylase-like domain